MPRFCARSRVRCHGISFAVQVLIPLRTGPDQLRMIHLLKRFPVALLLRGRSLMTPLCAWAPNGRTIEGSGARYWMTAGEHGWRFAEVSLAEARSDDAFVLASGDPLPETICGRQDAMRHGCLVIARAPQGTFTAGHRHGGNGAVSVRP